MMQKGPEMGQREAIRAIRTLGTALEHMTRGSDQRIELELALFSHVSSSQMQYGDVLEIKCTVRNVGKVAGKEVPSIFGRNARFTNGVSSPSDRA